MTTTDAAAPATLPPATADPLAVPLHGLRLIEASAGTGKTWTIAALVLRLVLGHGVPRPLLAREVLVLSFTRAATRELASRIRGRLAEAAAALRAPDDDATRGDPVLQGLRAAHPPGPLREAAAWRAATAADSLDDAAVQTLDAWCLRMLREHAFDSGQPFDEALLSQEDELLTEAAHDVWREQITPLQGTALATVLALWPRPQALAAGVRPLLDWAETGPLPALRDVAERHASQLADLKPGWVGRSDRLRAWLLDGVQADPPQIDKSKVRLDWANGWTLALRLWAEDPLRARPDLTEAGQRRLTPAGVRDALSTSQAARRQPAQLQRLLDSMPPEFAEFEALMQALDALPGPPGELNRLATAAVARRLQQLKAQRRVLGFSDLQQRLHDALDPTQRGPAADRLRQRILQQTPVALVDEFQDTSPLQWALLRRLFEPPTGPLPPAADGAANDPPEAAQDQPTLLLIGDPKQAIYGFRGADIYSYLQASRATRGRHHRLDTNHRSTAPLVAAVNALFDGAEQRHAEGAFLLRTATDDPLPFAPVRARGLPERLTDGNGPVPAVTVAWGSRPQNRRDALSHFAQRCAGQVVAWLADPAAGFVAEPPAGAGPVRRLRPADLAVLVRGAREAQAVRRALRRRGVASVYLSDRESVFATPEAEELLHLLRAVASPRDLALARTALAGSLRGLPLADLCRLADDPQAFDLEWSALDALHQTWRRQGVLAMVRQALHRFGLPARWLQGGAEGGGERRLTNVLHLAELLQAASTARPGLQALCRWLAQQCQASRGDGAPPVAAAEQVLRLESDAGLVQVITVHKSKGLQYPVVLLPFATLPGSGGRRSRNAPVVLPTGQAATPPVGVAPALPDDGTAQPATDTAGDRRRTRRICWSPGPDERQALRQEQLREDTRLLYVALTRARHALWIGAPQTVTARGGGPPSPAWPASAIGTLLGAQDDAGTTDLPTALQGWAGQAAGAVHLHEDDGEPVPLARWQPPMDTAPLGPALRPAPGFERDWAISSYSALVRGLVAPPMRWLAERRDDEGTAADPATPLAWAEPAVAPGFAAGDETPAPQPVAARVAAAAPWHAFARGAQAGEFLHTQLEWLADEGFALADSPALQQALRRRCERQGLSPDRTAQALAWLEQLCRCPLPPLGAALGGLDAVWPEMEFWLPHEALDARQVDELCRQHLWPGMPRPALPARRLQGLWMGFADLVYAHQGRHGVIDYKSNQLGPDDAAYGVEALRDAVLAHRYDVQAALYVLALHRLLQARLGTAYTPARQLGGACFWFLRGVQHPATAGVLAVEVPLPLLEALEALLSPAAAWPGESTR